MAGVQGLRARVGEGIAVLLAQARGAGGAGEAAALHERVQAALAPSLAAHTGRGRKRRRVHLRLPVGQLLPEGTPPGEGAALAAQWCAELPRLPGLQGVVAGAACRGPLLQVELDPAPLAHAVLGDIAAAGEAYGRTDVGQGGRILVEFSSPNLAKPFHAGHLRSTMLGAFLGRLHGALGFQVHHTNYLGDWGTQFGLLGAGFERYGSAAQLETAPLDHLLDVYVQANTAAEADPALRHEARQYFADLEAGAPSHTAFWERIRGLSVDSYTDMYRRLNVAFDEYDGESRHGGAATRTATAALHRAGLLAEEEGARVAVFPEADGLPRAVLVKRDGSSTYLARDLAAARHRHAEFGFEKMLYVVASQQGVHFRQLFSLLRHLGHEWAADCEHVDFGLVRGMSTRKGSIVRLDAILKEAKERMLGMMRAADKMRQLEDPEGTAEALALAAIVVQDHKAKRVKHYSFDWDRMLQTDGDTGPYLMYAHARMCSLQARTGVPITGTDTGLLVEPEAVQIVDLLSCYDAVLLSCLHTRDPSPLVGFLLSLARATSSAFEALRVGGSEPALAEQRMRLFWSARQVLASGLRLLGLQPLERV